MKRITDITFNGFGNHETIHITISNPEKNLEPKEGTETNHTITEELDIKSIFHDQQRTIYCRLSNNETAKFNRESMYKLLERLDEIDGKYYLNLRGYKILLEKKEL